MSDRTLRSFHVTFMAKDSNEHKFHFAMSILDTNGKVTKVDKDYFIEKYPKEFTEPGLYLVHEVKDSFHIHPSGKKK